MKSVSWSRRSRIAKAEQGRKRSPCLHRQRMNQRRQGLCSWGLSFNLICWKCRLKINIWSTKLIGGCWWRRWLPFRQIGSDDCWSWSDVFCEWFTTAADGNKTLFGNDPNQVWLMIGMGTGSERKGDRRSCRALTGNDVKIKIWGDKLVRQAFLGNHCWRIVNWETDFHLKIFVSDHNLSWKISSIFWFWHWKSETNSDSKQIQSKHLILITRVIRWNPRTNFPHAICSSALCNPRKFPNKHHRKRSAEEIFVSIQRLRAITASGKNPSRNYSSARNETSFWLNGFCFSWAKEKCFLCFPKSRECWYMLKYLPTKSSAAWVRRRKK